MPEFVLGDTPEYETIPDGEIAAAELDDVQIRDSFYEDDDGNKKKQVNFRFRITEGEWTGKVVFGSTPTTFTNHPDCKLRVWVQELLGQNDLPVGFKFDTDTLVGLPCRIAVGERAKKAADGTEVKKNFVADVLRANSAALADEVF